MKTKCVSLSTEDFVRKAIYDIPNQLKEVIERISEMNDDDNACNHYNFEVRDSATCQEETQFIVR